MLMINLSLPRRLCTRYYTKRPSETGERDENYNTMRARKQRFKARQVKIDSACVQCVCIVRVYRARSLLKSTAVTKEYDAETTLQDEQRKQRKRKQGPEARRPLPGPHIKNNEQQQTMHRLSQMGGNTSHNPTASETIHVQYWEGQGSLRMATDRRRVRGLYRHIIGLQSTSLHCQIPLRRVRNMRRTGIATKDCTG